MLGLMDCQRRVVDAYEKLGDYKAVAEHLHLSPHTVRARMSEARRIMESPHAQNFSNGHAPTPKVSYPEAVYTGRVGQYTAPLYTGHGVYEVDKAIVCGDVHIPCTDWSLAERMCEVALAQKIDTLFVVGDFWNFDILSRYDHIAPPAPLAVELEAGSRLMMRWRQVFKRIIARLGNHDVRLHKLLHGGVTTEMMELFFDAQQGVEFLPYGHVEILSGGQRWRATHQAAYSKIKLRVADTLAQKYHENIISLHQHHVGKSVDTYGRYVIVDGGGLFDSRKFAYVNLFDNTAPVMNQGFVVLNNGWADVLTPYPAMTNWGMWL